MNQLQQYNEATADIKRAKWGALGVGVYKGEIFLQARAQQIINNLIVAKTPEDIQAAELSLSDTKKELTSIIEERKKITSRFLDVTKRLMLPEQNIDCEITKAATALLEVKQQKEAEDRIKKQKEDELKQVAEKVALYTADIHASYVQTLAKLLSDSYVYALSKIEPDNISVYLEKIKKHVTIAKYTMAAPAIKAIHNTQQVVDEKIIECFNPKAAQEYVDGFFIDLEKKYFDYALAWKNKEIALQQNTEELQENTIAIENEKTSNVVAAKLQTLSTPVAITTPIKPLKKVYKLDIEETIANAILINTAFLSNQQLCLPHLQIKKAFNLSVTQMIAALEKVKNEDENFNYTNIIFKEVDKL